MTPPTPLDAVPDTRYKAPVDPADAVPVLSVSAPPLLVPVPVLTVTPPPAPPDADPAETVTPPADDVPWPTDSEMAPPAPAPAVPDTRYKAPVDPADETPVLSTTLPLAVLGALVGADCSDSSPLPPAPDPVETKTAPPFVCDDFPADITILPPAPLFPEPTVTYTFPPNPRLAIPVPMKTEPVLP